MVDVWIDYYLPDTQAGDGLPMISSSVIGAETPLDAWDKAELFYTGERVRLLRATRREDWGGLGRAFGVMRADLQLEKMGIPDATHVRSLHGRAYRVGHWALIMGIVSHGTPIERPCWVLRWPDGVVDTWPVDDATDKLYREFK